MIAEACAASLYWPALMSTEPTLLCIDDEENGLKMRKLLFESEGFQVFTALDGPTGIDLFKAHAVDVVILDYSMPGMDGIAVAETLKKLRSAVPIIMLSAYPVPRMPIEVSMRSSQKVDLPAALLSKTNSLLHVRGHSHAELEGANVVFGWMSSDGISTLRTGFANCWVIAGPSCSPCASRT